MAGSYNGTGLLVEVWSACVGATLINATAGRRLAAIQNIGIVQLDIVTYERVRSLVAAQDSSAAFQKDLKRCAAVGIDCQIADSWHSLLVISLPFLNLLPILHLAAASSLLQSLLASLTPLPRQCSSHVCL